MEHYFTLIIVLLLIAVNAVFVISEIAIIASKKSRLSILKTKGSKGAAMALRLKELPEIFLSTVQVGITLVNIFIGMFTGQEVAGSVVEYLKFLQLEPEVEQVIAYVITLLVVTYLTVLGELVPKRIALAHPEAMAAKFSMCLHYATYAFFPLIWLLNKSTSLVVRLFRIKSDGLRFISLDEIRYILNQARSEGVFASTEHDIIRRIINLNDMQIGSIMVPRFDMEAVLISDSLEIISKKVRKTSHSFMPLVDANMNAVHGIIATKKFLSLEIKDIKDISKAYANFIFMPDVAKVTSLIEQMRNNRAQVGIVVDEHGTVEGMVTINDIFKIFINDLAHISEERSPIIKKDRRNQGYTVDGNISADEAMELMQITSLPNDNNDEYRTLASFIFNHLGRVPKLGDTITAGRWDIKVVGMKQFRITKVKLRKKQGGEVNA